MTKTTIEITQETRDQLRRARRQKPDGNLETYEQLLQRLLIEKAIS